MSKEAMKLALEALQKIYIAPEHEDYIKVWWPACEQAITALREALAEQPAIKQDLTPEQQAQQEPVAWLVDNGGDAILIRHYQNFPGVFAGSEFNKRPLVFGDISPQAQPQQEPVAWPIDGDTARRIADKICVSYETVQQVARELVAMQPAQPQKEPVAWPAGLIERIKAAEQRIQDGHAPRRIPADPTDVDLVLAEVRYLLEGKQPPFWLHTSPQPAQQEPVCYKHGDEPKQGCVWCDKQPAQQQEPVAWLVYAKGSRRYFTLTFDVEKVPEIYKGGEAVPLYTSPPAQRKPLTEEEILDANWVGNKAHITACPAPTAEGLIAFARAIEAAHGIKGDA